MNAFVKKQRVAIVYYNYTHFEQPKEEEVFDSEISAYEIGSVEKTELGLSIRHNGVQNPIRRNREEVISFKICERGGKMDILIAFPEGRVSGVLPSEILNITRMVLEATYTNSLSAAILANQNCQFHLNYIVSSDTRVLASVMKKYKDRLVLGFLPQNLLTELNVQGSGCFVGVKFGRCGA